MPKRILVTGGAGFIGSSLVRALLKKKQNVAIIDNFNDYYESGRKCANIESFKNDPSLKLYPGDITDRHFLGSTVKDYRPTHVVHLAALPGVRASFRDAQLYTNINIVGTINLLEAIKNLPIQHFILGSSSSVYSGNALLPFSEDHLLHEQTSPYAMTKRAAEVLCKIYSGKYAIPTTCLRFFTVYGPRQRPDQAIYLFITSILRNTKVKLYGDGTSSRDYTYIDDLIDGISKSIDKPFPFEIINLGSAESISLKQLVATIEQITKKKMSVVFKDLSTGESLHTLADISKAKRLLKWSPKISLIEGLKKTIVSLTTNDADS